ncbi:MAG TPA: metallophosphoesterase [Ktedonobacterales bacterium]
MTRAAQMLDNAGSGVGKRPQGACSINIAVFADTHGRALLCFLLSARWQRETGERVDLILQAGDLGAYPDHQRLDGATKRWGERDPSELAFRADFAQLNPEVEALLRETTCPLIFVRGNHEDHNWLDAREHRSPLADALFGVDVYGRIFCLKTAAPYTFETPDARLNVLGIGRIGPHSADDPHQVRPKYVQRYERERLLALGEAQVDVLLTHDAPPGLLAPEPVITPATGHARRGDIGGVPEIGFALEYYRPAYHFFGHYGGPHQQWSVYGDDDQTAIHKLADLNWDRSDGSHRLRAGCMGMLRWNGSASHSFEVIDAPWLREYAANRWRFL